MSNKDKILLLDNDEKAMLLQEFIRQMVLFNFHPETIGEHIAIICEALNQWEVKSK